MDITSLATVMAQANVQQSAQALLLGKSLDQIDQAGADLTKLMSTTVQYPVAPLAQGTGTTVDLWA
ncbi:MAG: YjfB family protein [Treponema sp.]|nr:YjfB family protein [Treponema sp.]